MLKFFGHGYSCNILIESTITREDYELLVTLFAKPYDNWSINFAFIYVIESDIIALLYQEIVEKKKQIEIITSTYKISRYLRKLGFKVTFNQPQQKSSLDLDAIDVVLIGGSAGSSDKIIEIVKNISLYNLTLVIVQHVEENFEGKFDEILQRYTNHKVSYARDTELIQKGAIYLAQRDKHLKIEDNKFVLSSEAKYNFARPSLSVSYKSFSENYKNRLLVIQECGYAADGVDVLEYLAGQKTKIIVQDTKECEAKSMVEAALDTGFFNHKLNEKDIIAYINLLDKDINSENFIDLLLNMIFQKYGYDFRLYQRGLVQRRLNIFMIKYGIKKLKDLIEVVLFDKKMFKEFFAEVSINVTELFRNPRFFSKVTDFLNRNFQKSGNLKIWSAGCSSGEEAYSMAILLKQNAMLDKTLIYATDFNKAVVQEAKNALYSNASFALAKENYKLVNKDDSLDNYVVENKNYVTIKEDIKERVLFFEHNLSLDSSFNEFDIIICKNVLIYFDTDLQEKVFELFYDSLKFGGFLIIGESEQIHEQFKNRFKAYDLEYKLFEKVA